MNVKNKAGWKNFIVFLGVLGPGIIVNLADHDAGGIATYSVSGARYGYSIIWILIPTAVLLFMVQEMNARMGMVTGKGLAALIRERFSFRLTALIMLAMVVANFANTMSNFAGVAASSELFGVTPYVSVPLIAVAIWWLILRGSYRIVERIFLFTSLVLVSYIFSAFLARPDWAQVAKGIFIPSGRMDFSYIVMVITIIGTTVAPWMQFYHQSSIVDKGLEVKHLFYERVDTAIGTVAGVIIAVFIMVCCAAAFFNNPNVGATQITTAEQAAKALAPIAGQYASYLFATGMLFASILASSILPLTTAYTVCEAFGWEFGIDRSFSEAPKFYIFYTLFVAGGAILILIPKMPLITVMVISQTVNSLLLPVVLTCMLKIVRDRDIMGNYVNSDVYNSVAWVAVVILFLLDILFVFSYFLL